MNDSTLEQKTPAEINEIILYNDRFLVVAYSAGAVAALLLIINLLHLGGNRFVQGLNSIVALATAITTQVFALRIRERFKSESHAGLLWLSILIGFGLWALLEAIRMIVFFVAPDPRFSVLNWLWVIGYLPIFYGFYLRYVYLESPLTERQRQILWSVLGAGLLIALLALFVPLVTGRAPSLGGSLAGLLYALADLGLLFILGRIVISHWQAFGGPWKFFALAFVLKFMGSAVLQYPANLATGATGWASFFLSIANFTHYAWYGLAAMGLFTYEMILAYQVAPPEADVAKEAATPNANALLFTDEQDNVIKTSINFRYVMRLPENKSTSGVPLHELLGIPETVYQDLKAQLRRQGNLKKYVIEPAYFRAGHKAWLTAIVSADQQRRYNGMDMVVQVLAEGVAGAGLTNEERALVENIFFHSGAEGEDSEKLLVTYFNLNYRMLSGLVVTYEGSRRAAGLSDRVNQEAKKQKLLVRVLEQEINVPSEVKVDELGKSISVLLQAARSYVSDLAGADVVSQETDHLHSEIDRSTKSLIKKYDLARMN